MWTKMLPACFRTLAGLVFLTAMLPTVHSLLLNVKQEGLRHVVEGFQIQPAGVQPWTKNTP